MNIIDDLKISKSVIVQVFMLVEVMVGMSGDYNILIIIFIQVFCMNVIGIIMISVKELSIVEGVVILFGQLGYVLRFFDKGIGLFIIIEVSKVKVCYKFVVINDCGWLEGIIVIIKVNVEFCLVGSKK